MDDVLTFFLFLFKTFRTIDLNNSIHGIYFH